jgi:NADH:ubiquinone oxidoreductase subunit 3 (subunit A)
LGFYNVYFFKLLAAQFLLKYLIEVVFLLPITVFLKRSKLIALLIFLTIIHVLYMVYIGIAGNGRSYVWKDRVVR